MEKNTMQVLSDNLARLMREKGWNQTELAQAAKRHGGITQKAISNYLNQRNDSDVNPTLQKVEVLAATFGLHAWQLLSPQQNQQSTPVPIDYESFAASMKDGIALLHEAGLITDEQAKEWLDNADDVAKASVIIYNANQKEAPDHRGIFEFAAYLKARQV